MFELDFDESPKTQTKSQESLSKQLNFSVERSELLKALSHVQTVVERKNIIPILSNILLVAQNGRLELTATDMDLSASEQIIAQVLQEGSLTIHAQTFYEIIKKLPTNCTVNIKTSEDYPGKVTMSSGRSVFHLPYLDAQDFPSIDEGILPFNFKIPSSELKLLIDKNKFSISTEETRYNLNGIYWHIDSNDESTFLKAVATDGHRLSCYKITLPTGAEKIPATIIPRKATIELRKIIDNIECDINVSLSESKIKFTFENAIFVSKLIDGSFPEYKNLIPDMSEIFMKINCNDLKDAIDRVSTISVDNKTKSVKFLISETELRLTVVCDDNSVANESIPCESNVNDFEIALNSRYVIDVLGAIDDDKCVFEFNDTKSSVVIHDEHSKSSLFVIMPMRV